ncbi:S41 family peptidase [Bacteroidales bacterium OttesenSCG-928-I14]|nr:S41 family peptidase [Bacteroidales bacterium OttesenSCG-928-I14]
MRHLFLSAVLTFCLVACSYGQRRTVDPSYEKVNRAMLAIENLYVDTVNKEKLAEDAIIALLERLDPHSSYLSGEDLREKTEPLQGNFDGIGIQFNTLTDTLYVVQVISGGPSEKVGIMAGDRIITVDDSIIAGVKMKNNDIMKLLRGPKGTVVNIGVKRGNNSNLIPFRITRDKIPIYSIDATYMLDQETGYIKVNRFAQSTYEEFKESVSKLQEQGMQRLILDLQANGGGYMQPAVDMSNEFLKQGNLIVYTEGVNSRRQNLNATYKGKLTKEPLVILVDEYSASASEIFAGAIQDWDRGVIVGRRTFGKGLVQRPIPLGDGSEIHLTVARYYTPSGRSIQKPYEKGNAKSYNQDLLERFKHGEFVNQDSIHFPDSLKYNTLVNKRTVYGGGGIMPDFFVPLDTTKYEELHKVLVSSGTMNKYVLNLIDKNRLSYQKQYPDFKKFESNFSVSDAMLRELIKLYKKERESDNSLPEVKEEDEKKLIADNNLVRIQIKALVARDLWEMNEYYQVMNSENESIQKALEIISDKKEYERLLGK